MIYDLLKKIVKKMIDFSLFLFQYFYFADELLPNGL